ncbi:hypothetical protein EDB85DRAFT_1904662 [Lactarius pseudohatsudake]|nr:hypothetical protein EDB85DRAFT_1904662 [Lactarius pseudohatsudake]
MSDIKNISERKDIIVRIPDIRDTHTGSDDDASSDLESFDEDDMYASDYGDDVICVSPDTTPTTSLHIEPRMSDIKNISGRKNIIVRILDVCDTHTESDDDASSDLESFDEDDIPDTNEESPELERSLRRFENVMAESRSLYAGFENIYTLARMLYDREYASEHDDEGAGASGLSVHAEYLRCHLHRTTGETFHFITSVHISYSLLVLEAKCLAAVMSLFPTSLMASRRSSSSTLKLSGVQSGQQKRLFQLFVHRKSGQDSHHWPRKKGTQPQHHAENANTSGTAIRTPDSEDPHMHLYTDEQQPEYPLQDTTEDCLPRPSSRAATGIRAAHTASAIRTGRALQRRSRSASLASVPEVLDSSDSAGQLPTPRETPQPEGPLTNPEISDGLFDSLDMYLESNDNDASRVRTADSGNPLFTVVDRGGIFDMEIVFCACSGTDNMGEQLLRAGLFPSTFKQIETLFTFSITWSARPRPSSIIQATKHDKQDVSEQGPKWKVVLGNQQEGERPPDGAMAIFCPACPQPGINLPTDWKTLYPPSGEKDVALSAGMAFMANPDSYRAHLQSGKEVAQANSSRAHLDVTGIGATACCHGFFVPTSVVDFQKGERICKALSYNMEDIPVALVMYDIMCQYRVHFQERVENSPELSLPSSLQLQMGIGLFHIHGHQDSCLPRYSPSYIQGAKQVDGEIIETLWAPLNNISRSLRGMSLDHRQEVLDAHINHSNWKKLVRIVPSLLKRWKRLKPGLDASSKAYEALNQHFKHKSEQWLKDDECAQQDRQTSPSSMDIYDTVKEKAPSRATIQQQLIEEESGDHSIHGETSWISCGLKIQELHSGLRDPSSLWKTHKYLRTSAIAYRSLLICSSTKQMHSSPHLRATDNAPVWSLGDYAEYDNADDIDDSGNPGPASSESLNAEDIPLLLPSSLGWEWIRLALGFKSALYRTQVRDARSQRTKTRAWTAVHSVDSTVHQHARNYSMARDAYLKVQDASGLFPELLPLRLTDLRVSTAILGAAQVGQRNTQLAWIWSFGTSERQDGTWMDEFNRVHWLRAKAQFERWKEEQHSIRNEAIWIPAYFHSKAECWKAWMDMEAQALRPGHKAYASRQAHAWEELSKSSIKALIPITSTLLEHL